MNVQQAYEKLKKMVDDGNGEAVLVHTDTRSGVTENCCVGSISVLENTDGDFYADVKIGSKYLSIYEGK